MDRRLYENELSAASIPVEVVETDVDLYWSMALDLYGEVERNNGQGRSTTAILPVGPVFQYRRLVRLLGERPLDLSHLSLFFMDEYLDPADPKRLIPAADPLSFRGFIARELVTALPTSAGLKPDAVRFPDPEDPDAYDRALDDAGGADLCHAGLGITGHLAFNEPVYGPGAATDSMAAAFLHLPTRIIELDPATVAINAHTALRGATDQVPRRAVTIGMRQIMSARRLRIYCNRPWQSAVVRRALFEEASTAFPATLVRRHPDLAFTITAGAAERPEFALK